MPKRGASSGSPHSGAPAAASESPLAASPGTTQPLPSPSAGEAADKKAPSPSEAPPPHAWEEWDPSSSTSGSDTSAERRLGRVKGLRLRVSPFLRLWKLRVEQGACRGSEHGPQLPAFPQPRAAPYCRGLFEALFRLVQNFLLWLGCVRLVRFCNDPGMPPPPPGCACLAAAPPSALPCAIDLTPGAALTEAQVRALPVPRRDAYMSHVIEGAVKLIPTLLYYASPAIAIILIIVAEMQSYIAAYTFDILTCGVPALNLTQSLGSCAPVIASGCIKYPLSKFVLFGIGVDTLIIVATAYGLALFLIVYILMAVLRRWALKLLPFHIYYVRSRLKMTIAVLALGGGAIVYVASKTRTINEDKSVLSTLVDVPCDSFGLGTVRLGLDIPLTPDPDPQPGESIFQALWKAFAFLIVPGMVFLYAIFSGPVKEGFLSYSDMLAYVPASAFLRCQDKGCTLHNIGARTPSGEGEALRIQDQLAFKLGEGRCDLNAAPFYPTSFVRLDSSTVEEQFDLVSLYLDLPPLRPKHWSTAAYDPFPLCNLCDAEFGLLLAHIAWISSPPSEALALAQRLARASHGFYAPAAAVMPATSILPANIDAAAPSEVALRTVEVASPRTKE